MFPLARCEGCGTRDACEAVGAARPEYPRCRSPLRGVDLGRMTALLAFLRSAAGADEPATRALEGVLLARFDRDRSRFSDVLEASFSCDPEGAHLYRFSYAFPGWRADPSGVEATLRDLCRPFGAYPLEVSSAIVRAARSRAVEQILFGFAHDGRGRFRVKLYLQFYARESATALLLAGGLLGRRPGQLPEPGALHLLCMDLGSRGLAGAKLYFVLDRVRIEDLPARVGPVPLVASLADLGVTELRDVLAIHRLRAPDDESVGRAAEIDFSLPDNDVRWEDVRRLGPVRRALAESPAIEDLMRSFRLAVRRLSGSVGDAGKLNVYYVLAEMEPGAEARHAR